MTFSFTTIMSTLAGISAVVMGVMTDVLGCHPGVVELAATCSAPWIPTAFAGYAAILFGGLAFISKLAGAGGPAANLWGLKAVVLPEDHPHSGVGTVTPAQVALP